MGRRIGGMVVLALFTLGLAVAAPVAASAAYPEKPVTVIVPFAAGGGVDLTARMLSETIRPFFPQPLTVLNKPGGGGTVGAAEVVVAKADGYTIGIAGGSLMIQPHVLPDLPYKGPSDYQPLLRAVTVPTVFAVRSNAPWTTMKALLDDARANPAKIRAGSAGRGTAPGLALEAMKVAAKVNVTHVPFGGSSEAITNLLGGHIDAAVATAAEVLPQVRAGKVKVLAALEDKRVAVYPEAPTLAELGHTMISGVNPYLLFAPKDTPEPVLQALHEALRKAMETEAFRKYAADNSYLVEYRSRADLRADLDRLDAFFRDIVNQLGLRKK